MWTKELKAMNTLKQSRDNFQCGGKDELNLKLTFFIMASFFRNLEVLNPGIKSVKNVWNLKQVWITPKSLSHFHSFCQVFIKKFIHEEWYFKYHITKFIAWKGPVWSHQLYIEIGSSVHFHVPGLVHLPGCLASVITQKNSSRYWAGSVVM